MQNDHVKKLFLYTLIGSVALSALMGISVVLLGDFGAREIRVLLTTVTVTMVSILGLACGAYLETGRGRALPLTGIAFSIIAGAMLMFVIWDVLDDFEGFIKTAMTAVILASSCSHLSLLSLAKLDKRFAWSRTVAFVLVSTISAILLYLLWAEPKDWDDLVWRGLAVLSILLAAVTVVTPVLHKLSSPDDAASIDDQITKLQEQIAVLERQKAELGSS